MFGSSRIGCVFFSKRRPSGNTADKYWRRDLYDRFYLFCPNAITQNFPTIGPVQTTWLICWHEVAGYNSIANPNGLVIGPVYFRKSPSAPFVRVLWDMRVSDYFVPYHPGNPRYYDLSAFNFVLTSVSAADCPACQGGGPISPHVCKEVHDRGLMWQRMKELDKALVDLDRAVRMSFTDPEVYSDRGAVWFEKGRYDRALADLNQAIKINPLLATAYVRRAGVFERKGDPEHARADRDQATLLDRGTRELR